MYPWFSKKLVLPVCFFSLTSIVYAKTKEKYLPQMEKKKVLISIRPKKTHNIKMRQHGD